MNPQFDQTPGLHLPQPNGAGQQPAYGPGVVGMPPQPAGVLSAQPLSGGPTQPPVQPDFQQPAYAGAPAQAAVAPAVTALDDGDAAGDEEWVTKARDITMRYKGDPFMQSKELSKLKAQYVKARYNKDVKLNEDR